MVSTHNFNVCHGAIQVLVPDGLEFKSVSVKCPSCNKIRRFYKGKAKLKDGEEIFE